MGAFSVTFEATLASIAGFALLVLHPQVKRRPASRRHLGNHFSRKSLDLNIADGSDYDEVESGEPELRERGELLDNCL